MRTAERAGRMETEYLARHTIWKLKPTVAAEIDLSWRGLYRCGLRPDFHCPHEALGFVREPIDFITLGSGPHLGHLHRVDHRRRAVRDDAGEGTYSLSETAAVEVLHHRDDIAAAEAAAVEDLLAGVDAEPVSAAA